MRPFADVLENHGTACPVNVRQRINQRSVFCAILRALIQERLATYKDRLRYF